MTWVGTKALARAKQPTSLATLQKGGPMTN